MIACIGTGPHEACLTCNRCFRHSKCRCRRCEKCKAKKPPKDFCASCKSRDRYACLTCHASSASALRAAVFPERRCEFGDLGHTYQWGLRRSLGVEVECATWGSLNTTIPPDRLMPNLGGTFVRDGSVKPSGLELVSGKLTGDSGLRGLYQLATTLKAHSATANSSCGVHVHVDAADFSMFELRRILIGWHKLQHSVFGTLVAEDRQHSYYCPPNTYTADAWQRLLSCKLSTEISEWFYHSLYGLRKRDEPNPMVFADRIRHFRATKYVNEARRWALNFHSWMMRGTLEFRLKEGTVEPEDLFYWPLWCGFFVEWLAARKDSEVLAWQTAVTPPTILEITESFPGTAKRLGIQAWVAAKTTPTTKEP